MYRLIAPTLTPDGRLVRLALAEKGLDAAADADAALQRLDALLSDASADTPSDPWAAELRVGPHLLRGGPSIVEYLEETAPGRRLWPVAPDDRAEARRIAFWASGRLFEDATRPLLEEKWLTKRRGGAPSSDRIRQAAAATRRHLGALSRLCERREQLAGEDLTVADLATAAQLSTLDYLDCVAWDAHTPVKRWYALIKCRPAFRGLLNDRLQGMPPPSHYADLDF